tara:strand:+ start:436 stop:1869 length:1434 start_codon:yes stop_codon:yes gene_type:complete
MVEPAKKKTTKKSNSSSSTIRIVGDNLVIENLKIKNPQLVELLKKEKNKDKQTKLIEEIIDYGINLFNTLKGRVETDYAKNSFESIKGQLNDKLDSTLGSVQKEYDKYLDSVQKEYDKYFDTKKGSLPLKVEETSEKLEESSKDLVKNFSEKTSELLDDLEDTFGDFLDEDSKKSALGKISMLLDGFDKKIDDMLKDAKTNQIDAFEKALDPEEKKSKIKVLRDQINKTTESEIKSLSEKVDEIIKKLNIQSTEEELLEKSTQKGAPFEDIVQATLSKIALSTGDIVSPTSNETGKKGKKGDHTVELDKSSTGMKKINLVFESKTETMTFKKIREYLEECIDNRDAEVGIMVFDKVERIQKVTELPFYPFDGNKAIVILNSEESGDLPLQVAYMWARITGINLSNETFEEESLDLAEIQNKITESIGILTAVKEIKKGHTQAKKGVDHSSKFLSEMEEGLKENLNFIKNMFEDVDKD